ncbi:carbohydrate ABC transporter permease [Paenibacillus eucommiae]|uniref:Aldouronate transport system permease protein n=1 Tax=Paenibacillus eucommiae TaxID=1355755 RepID=A0ABS4IV45_9BACL|nr:carbohydrate ABC transporter permease [Paenibacillus eucommiae]MBP1991462.1 putative aldouronate transport system permease protein [Paenibacillus eucommiae]
MLNYRTPSRIIFEIITIILLVLLCVSIVVPFINAMAISLSSSNAVLRGTIGLWPKEFQMDAYKMLAGNYTFLRSFANTVFLTIVNTILVIVVSLAAAYALASKNMLGKKIFFYYILLTMFFSGGLIPTYLLVNGLGLNNTYWALILPGICSVFYIIVFKNVIDQLPQELLESAEMDGASDLLLLFRIVLPLVLPMTMAFTIFSAVAFWNEWFGVMLYIRDKNLWTLQYQLRDILMSAQLSNEMRPGSLKEHLRIVDPQNLKMAALMLTVLPIIVVYPFVQKYFIHGQMVGAVKG